MEEKSKKEIFKDSNRRKKMDKLFRFLNPPNSFKDLKDKSQEIKKNLSDEQDKQRKKKKSI